MKEIDYIKKIWGPNFSIENFLLETAKSHGLFTELKTVKEDNTPETIEMGDYLVIGANQAKVKKMASSYSNAVLFPFEVLRQWESSDVFPKCTIIKMVPTFRGIVDVLGKILELELAKVLFAEYKLELPEVINRNDFQTIYRSYKGSIEPNGEVAQADLEYFLKVIASNKTLEEYEKENGNNSYRHGSFFTKKEIDYSKKLADKIASKKVKYSPVSKNCVSYEHILFLPYSKSKINVAHGKDGETIRRVDEELGHYPEIKWSLQEESTIEAFTQEDYQYWHALTYPTKYEARVAGIVHKNTHRLDLKGEDFCKIYIKGANDNITSSAIPEELFEAFAIQAAQEGVEYYYDECSTYVAHTPTTIGICVENEADAELLFQIEVAMIKLLAKDSHLRS